ncbi:hypothetical protein ACIOKD_25055 [Streptomyces sp. NPDC087844]|uniref:hypothetical protein n=1 Tax=Streptomyces sp. NPDC087844 TaxID=3365805 RepID=UPI0037F6FD87
MNTDRITPQEAARWALRAGLPLSDERREAVAGTAEYIQSVIATLRELDFGDIAPAAVYITGQEHVDAAV